MKTKRYSYSKISLFNSCPLKYKFIYIDKKFKKDESIEAFLGKAIHKTLEWIYKEKLDKNREYYSLDHVINIFKENWHDSWHSNVRKFKYIQHKKSDYFTNGINSLVKYYQKFGPYISQKVYRVEEEFEFQLNEYRFRAIIDRIDKEDDTKIHIIDYKTGKNMITEKQLQNDLQMGIYLFAARDRYPDIKEIKLSHYYISLDQEVSIDSSELKNSSFADNLIENIKSIEKTENKGDFPPEESKLCNWCYYWNECSLKSNNHPSIYLK